MSARALMSIDVEDWFQVENLRAAIPRDSWDGRELRVEGSTHRVLDALDAANTKSTFFVLGWVAQRLPGLVREIHARGHEIGCHGYGHQLLPELGPEAFRADLRRAKAILEDLAGEPVIGYRAPSFSITDWAIDVLAESGFRYDSSLFPAMAHDRYGKLAVTPPAGTTVFELRPGFHQVGLACLPIAGRNMPWAGGGYFRLMPYALFRWGVRRILDRGTSFCFYAHPWEFDPGQPVIRDVRAWHRFRHYNNLARTEGRFERLLRDFRFAPIRTALPA